MAQTNDEGATSQRIPASASAPATRPWGTIPLFSVTATGPAGLKPMPEVRVTVVDDGASQPVAGRQVSVNWPKSMITHLRTDARGEFVVKWAGPGECKLSCDVVDDALALPARKVLSDSDWESGKASWVLPEFAYKKKLLVKVLDKVTSEPISRARIAAMVDGRCVQEGKTDENGEFAFSWRGQPVKGLYGLWFTDREGIGVSRPIRDVSVDEWKTGKLTMLTSPPRLAITTKVLVKGETGETVPPRGAVLGLRRIYEGRQDFCPTTQRAEVRWFYDLDPGRYIVLTSDEYVWEDYKPIEYDGKTPVEIATTVVPAETYAGRLLVRVRDARGDGIGDVTVRLTGGKKPIDVGKTNEKGEVVAEGIKAGEYTTVCEKTGWMFRTGRAAAPPGGECAMLGTRLCQVQVSLVDALGKPVVGLCGGMGFIGRTLSLTSPVEKMVFDPTSEPTGAGGEELVKQPGMPIIRGRESFHFEALPEGHYLFWASGAESSWFGAATANVTQDQKIGIKMVPGVPVPVAIVGFPEGERVSCTLIGAQPLAMIALPLWGRMARVMLPEGVYRAFVRKDGGASSEDSARYYELGEVVIKKGCALNLDLREESLKKLKRIDGTELMREVIVGPEKRE
jgi:hypothetical protein